MTSTPSLTLAESTSSLTSAAPLPSSSQTDANAERPTLLVLDNTTATALATTTTSAATVAATSPSAGSVGSAGSVSGGGGGGDSCGSSNNSSTATSPSFLPEMPQWKKDLIQRRKTNVARTIGAASAAITPTSPLSSSSTATTLPSSLQQQRGSITLSDQQQTLPQQDITDGLETPIKKDFTLKSTTVYQTHQQQQQLTTTKVSTTSQQLQIINAKSNLGATTITTKMPATNIATATLNSPTQRNSPLSTIITKDKVEKFLGGHYTPQATADATSTKDEYERIDRKDIIEQHKQLQQHQQMATKSSSPLSSPTKSSSSHTTSPPIPKQRSLFLASKYQNTNTKEEQEISTAACTISTVSSHASFASGSSDSSSVTSSPPGNNNNRNNERNIEKRGVATNANNINTTATATKTRLTSSSLLRERIVFGAAATSATDYNDDGNGSAVATPVATTTADEVIEMQDTETTRKSSTKATTKSRNGTYASIQEQQQLLNLMQSTTTTTALGGTKTNTTTTPTGANTATTTPPLLSPTVTSMLSIQSHSKYESERTSSKLTNSIYTKANATTTTIPFTTSPDNCEKPFIILSNYSSALAVSGSGNGASVGSVVNNKISNKLQNNQFIKNQQNTAATSSATASKYHKYKTYSLQESQAITNIPCNNSAPTGSGSGSPNKSPIAAAAAAATTTTATATTSASSSKKKMVAMQEMMKTTQNAASHHHHHHAHHAHHNHQQHHNQHHQIIGGVGAATTCARQQQQINSNGNVNNRHQRSGDSEKDANFVVDNSEDLSYGPGIVSKLRCRYLSLALRESMEKQRHCMDNLRRATSLNNLLDRDDHHKDHDVDDQEEDDNDYEDEEVELRSGGGDKKRGDGVDSKHRTGVVGVSGILKYNSNEESLAASKKTATFQKYVGSTTNGGGGGRMSLSQHGAANNGGSGGPTNDSQTIRSRHVKRGNDSLKRARSVEALLCEKSPWTSFALNRTSLDPTSKSGSASTIPPTCVTIEDKIQNARGRLISGTDVMPPKRLTSIIDDTERPPPDLVKQTLKLFEATANRRPRANRANGKGDVASKVANYKTIIKENKPAIVFPKPPSSPTKKSAHVKPAAKPVVAAADLIGSPIGRKTSAATSTSNTPNAMEQHLLSSSTPKHASNANTPLRSMQSTSSTSAAAASGGNGCLSQNTPDIIPRHKLLAERASESTAGIDSPVTALTKKLEKLSIESDKHQTIKQSGSNNSNKSSNVTTKESQAKQQYQQQQQQAHKLTAEPLNYSNEVNNEQQHDNDYSNKFVGGSSSGGGHSASGGDGGGGGDAVENDKKSDRTALGTTTETIEQQPNTVQAGTAAISSDLSDDEYGLTTQQTQTATKRVTKTALDNIAKAGTTQQFQFAVGKSTTAAATNPTKANTNGSQSYSSDSPVSQSLLQPYALNTHLNSDIPSSVLNAAPGKQIGVIRPLLTNNTQTATTTTNYSNITTTTNTSTNNQQLQHMEALKQQTIYSPHHSSLPIYTSTNTTSAYTPPTPQLTSREIEKNRINEMKKIALTDHAAAATANASVSANATATASSTSSLYTVINTNSSSSSVKSHTVATATTSSSMSSTTSGFSELDSIVAANNSPLWALRKKRQAPAAVAENTTMVFNFSNRKEVPDYIENDGVIFRRKRELPKPNESGFVLLGDLSLETSTDSDYDDFSMCPPSPCDVEFENANIVIDGKSSIRQKSKEATFRVQFNDTLTSTFEYPSEASLVIEDSFSVHYGNSDDLVSAYENLVLEDNTDSPVHHHHHVAVDEIIQLPTTQSNTSPAHANNSSTQSTATTNTPTKNILGNLPLDYPNLAKGIMLQQLQQSQLEEQHQQQPQVLKETQQPQQEEPLEKLPQVQQEQQEKLPMQYEKKENEQQKQQPQQQLPPVRPTDLPLIPIAMPMMKANPATTIQMKDKPKVPTKRFKINPKLNKLDLNELQKGNEDDIILKQRVKVETLEQQEQKQSDTTAASSSNHQTNMLPPETTTATKVKIIRKPPIEMIIPEYKPPRVVRDFKLASFEPTTTITSTITTGSNTTECHTTPATTTTATTTTTLTPSSAPLPPQLPIIKRYQRKTPTVLNKPQYAHFLQNDLLSQKQGSEEENVRNNIVLRTRSNEFLLNNNNNHNNNMYNRNPMKFSYNNLSPNSFGGLNLQQRSSSFSFGSAPLGFYMPVKAPIDNLFELGVTRAPNGSSHTTNGSTHNGSVIGINDGLNGSSSNGSAAGNGGGGDENDEPESLQYIKPTNDDLTIAYSEGAQKTDLLY